MLGPTVYSLWAIVFVCGSCVAQSSVLPHFEVASIKPAPDTGFQSFSGGPRSSDPERAAWDRTPLQDLIQAAYLVESYQVSGPSWIKTERYSVTAKVPKGTTAAQFRQMLINLIVERFGLVVHRQRKQFQGYEITVAAGRRLKLTTSPTKNDNRGFHGQPTSAGIVHYTFKQTTMQMFADDLRMLIPRHSAKGVGEIRTVIDRTGVAGEFDFDLDVTEPASFGENDGPGFEDNFGALSDALQNQLGLKLSHAKVEGDLLVIDHVERVPTAN